VRKAFVGLIGLTLATGTVVTLGPAAFAESAPAAVATSGQPVVVDDLPNPLEDKRRDLREQAVSDVVSGKLTTEVRNGSTVAKVGKTNGGGQKNAKLPAGKKTKDQYVELNREKTDRIFVILTEFGNQRSANYPDQDTDPDTPGPVKFDGPLHNAIPEPNRAVDNSTVWRPDFSQSYFQDLYFGGGESLRNYYETQSSGRYSVNGEVTDWVKVPYNEARYGRSDGYPCATNVCSNTWARPSQPARSTSAWCSTRNVELRSKRRWIRLRWFAVALITPAASRCSDR
jgi:immune inhibitor A